MGPLRLRSVFWLCLAFCVTLVGAKLVLIQGWGTDVPYWDEWDGIGDHILLKQAEGHLTAADFMRPHNEHRIVYTRLLTLGLVRANGEWDGRLEMAVNAFLHAGALALLLAIAARALTRNGVTLLAIFTAVVFAMPFAWENTLAGFQSQFYFILWFAFLHIAGAGLARTGSRWWWIGQIAGAAGLIAMASGFLSAVIVAGLTLARCLTQRRRPAGLEWFNLLWCAAIVAVGFLLRVEVAGHEPLRAHSFGEWLETLAWLTAWPVNSPWACALIVLPIAWVTVRAWRAKFSDFGSSLVAALGGWWLLQTVLLAYGRGGEAHALSPRYFDSLVIGSVAGALAWLHLFTVSVAPRRQGWIAFGALGWCGIIVASTYSQARHQWFGILRDMPIVNASRESTLRDFVRGRTSTLEGKRPWDDLPYPDPKMLEAWLRHPAIRAILPASVRAPLLPVAATPELGGFRANALPSTLAPLDVPTWSSHDRAGGTALWRSEPLRTALPLLRFEISGDLVPPDGRLALVGTTGEQLVQPAYPRRTNWGSVAVSAPRGDFRVEARSAAGHWLAFSAPIEIGQLTWLSEKLLRFGALLCWLGGLTLAGLLVGPNLSRLVAEIRAAPARLQKLPDRFAPLRAVLPARDATVVSWRWFVFVTLVSGVLLYLRKPHALTTPQLWAEDGSVFLNENETLGWRAFYTPYAGYLHLIPRLVALLASWTSPLALPAIYNTVSFLGWVAVAASFLSPRVELPGKIWLALAIALVPQTGEVLFQLCNLQWATALLLVRQLLLRPAESRRTLIADGAVLFLVGFTGPFSVVLWPLFAWRAWRFRAQRAAWFEFAVVTVAATSHVIASIVAPFPRAPSKPFDLAATLAFTGQRTLGVMLFGWHRAETLGRAGQLALFALLVALVVFALRRTWRTRSAGAIAVFVVAFSLLLGSTLVRGGSTLWEELHLGYGDRYLFIPRVLLCWILVLAMIPRGRAAPLFAAILLWSLWINRSAYTVPAPNDLHWRNYAAQLDRREPANIPILPEGWILQYPGKRAPR
ncbi:MAG TPA: hypothetical protein VHD62_00390 [Opitutaceae bacterium]|nr:hypothetical protein [Opitutaceae bacterium]